MNSLYRIDPQVLESFFGAADSLTVQDASSTSINAERLLTLAKDTLDRYDAELSEVQFSTALTLAAALSPIATEPAETLLMVALSLFYRNRLPSASPFTYTAPSLQFSTLRQLIQSLSDLHLTIGVVSVSIPSQWLNSTNLTSTDVVDLQFTALPGNLSSTVTVKLVKSGMYENYNVQFLQQPELISLFNSSAPFNISLPYAGMNGTEIECVGLDESKQWNSALCTVVGNMSGVVTISVSGTTTYTLRPITPISEPPEIEPPQPTHEDKDDDKSESINPIPMILAALVLIAGLAAAAIAKLWKSVLANNEEKKKNLQEIASAPIPKSEDPYPNEPDIICYTESSVVVIPQPTPPTSFWQFHALIHAVQDKSAFSIAPLAFLVMTELVVLGLCYTFWSSGNKSASDAGAIFSSYSGLDVVYVGIAVVVGTVAHTLCVLLLSAQKKVGAVLCGVVTLVEFGGVVVMNICLSFGPGGRWGEGALWAILIQFVIVETAKTALASTLRKSPQEKYPCDITQPTHQATRNQVCPSLEVQ